MFNKVTEFDWCNLSGKGIDNRTVEIFIAQKFLYWYISVKKKSLGILTIIRENGNVN